MRPTNWSSSPVIGIPYVTLPHWSAEPIGSSVDAIFTDTGSSRPIGTLLPENGALLLSGSTNCLPLPPAHVELAMVLKSPVSMAAVGMNVVLEGGFERLRVP